MPCLGGGLPLDTPADFLELLILLKINSCKNTNKRVEKQNDREKEEKENTVEFFTWNLLQGIN